MKKSNEIVCSDCVYLTAIQERFAEDKYCDFCTCLELDIADVNAKIKCEHFEDNTWYKNLKKERLAQEKRDFPEAITFNVNKDMSDILVDLSRDIDITVSELVREIVREKFNHCLSDE